MRGWDFQITQAVCVEGVCAVPRKRSSRFGFEHWALAQQNAVECQIKLVKFNIRQETVFDGCETGRTCLSTCQPGHVKTTGGDGSALWRTADSLPTSGCHPVGKTELRSRTEAAPSPPATCGQVNPVELFAKSHWSHSDPPYTDKLPPRLPGPSLEGPPPIASGAEMEGS